MAASRRLVLSIAMALALSVALALGGCGGRGKDKARDRISGTTLTIYASVPLHGPESADGQAILNGARTALAAIHDRIGRYRIVFDPLDDSTAQRGRWDPGQTTLNARTAAQNPTTIGYIGDFDSGASAISIPILNRAGIAQISPASSAVGLTSGGPGAEPGEPDKYYPARARTFARVVPSDVIQAEVQASLERSEGCKKTFVLDDGLVDGADAASTFEVAAQSERLIVTGAETFDPAATDFTSLAAGVAHSGANCALISAAAAGHAALLTEQLAAAMPSATIFGLAGMARAAYVDPAQGGIPLSLDARVVITAPPQPYGVYAYEAMRLLLGAISRATDGGQRTADRSAVVADVFATHDRRSVLGTYSIERDGDSTLRSYGIYRVLGGELALWKEITG